MIFGKRKRIEGLIAASLHEPLSEPDQRDLNEALLADPELALTAESLARLVRAVPKARPETPPNLSPLIRQHVASSEVRSARAWQFRPAFALGAAACLVCAGVLGYVTLMTPAGPATGVASHHAASGPETLIQASLKKADEYVAQRDLSRAYEILTAAVKAQPTDPSAGLAELRIADLSFELGLYPESLAAHERLFSPEYHATLTSSSSDEQRIVRRRDLLAEAQIQNFAALYAYNRAIRDRGSEVESLEEVIASHPNQTMVAELAVEEMTRLVVESGAVTPGGENQILNALNAVRARCTQPAAVAMVDLKIGDVYRNVLHDYPAAETHYLKAAENPVLAKRAQDAIESMPTAQN